MAYYTPNSESWFAFLRDAWLDLLVRLSWGPGTDPNKVAPPMAHYVAPEEWPDWCRVSSQGPNLVRSSFLSSLPRISEGRQGSWILDQVSRIRLRRLSHYKCNTDWNHEFIRADMDDGDGTSTHTTHLIVIWERDIPLRGGKPGTKRDAGIKLGLPCESIDRVTYISEANFQDYVKTKDAYCLRTADFPSSPGLDILQVACVLETHSLGFPMYHVYSTMCYWYADSTFEILCKIGQAKEAINDQTAKKRGVFTYKGTDYVAYTGITRESLKLAGLLEPTQSKQDVHEDAIYEQRLVGLQAELAIKNMLGSDENGSQELTAEELESIRLHGWNVARYLDVIRTMPTHQKMLDDSTARAEEVRNMLIEIQSGREAAETKAKREAEAKLCAEKEEEMRLEEAKWKREIEKREARLAQVKHQADSASQEATKERERAERERARADAAERQVAEERIRASKEKERADKERERAINAEEEKNKMAQEIAKLQEQLRSV